jgi:hypothetical protein
VPFFRWELKFIRSEFRGQLPKPYSPYPNATKIIPTEMNDMNKEEESRYVSEQEICETTIHKSVNIQCHVLLFSMNLLHALRKCSIKKVPVD